VADRIVWDPRNYRKAKLDVKLRGLKVMRSNYGLVASSVDRLSLDCLHQSRFKPKRPRWTCQLTGTKRVGLGKGGQAFSL
jgi:hypothetical protein